MKGLQLTARQVRFVESYLVSLNASEAARASGYVGKRANLAGNAMLRNAAVAAAVSAAMSARSEECKVTAETVLRDIGRVRSHAMEMVRDPATGVSGMRSMRDALRALELEGRHVGAFENRVELQVCGLDWRALMNLRKVDE